MVNIPTTGLLTNEGAGSAAGGAASSGFSFNTGLGYIGTAYNLQQGISDGDAAAIASAIGGAIGSVIPGVGTLVGALAGRAIGTVAQKVAGGAKKHRIEVPAIKMKSSPTLDMYALKVGNWRVTRNRDAQNKLPEFEKPFYTAIKETKERLSFLGMTDMLDWVNSSVAEYDKAKRKTGPVEILGSGAVQSLANIVQGADAVINKRFDEAESLGLDPKVRAEFNRQTEKKMFNVHSSIIENEIQKAYKTQELTSQSTDSRYKHNVGERHDVIGSDGKIDFNKISGENTSPLINARLSGFFDEHYADIVPNITRPKSVTKPGHTVEYIKGEKTYIPKRRTGNRQWTEAYWEPGQVTGVKIDGKYFSLDKSNHKQYSNVMKRVDTALKDVQTRVDTSAPPAFQFGVDTSRLDTPLLSGNQDIGALIKTHLSNLQQDPVEDPGSNTDTPNPQVPDANTDDPYPQDPGSTGDGGDYPGSDVPYDPSTDYPQEPPGDVNVDIPVIPPIIPGGDSGGDTVDTDGDSEQPRIRVRPRLPQYNFGIPVGGSGGGSAQGLSPVSTRVSRPNVNIPIRQYNQTPIHKRQPIGAPQSPGILSNIDKSDSIGYGLLTRN